MREFRARKQQNSVLARVLTSPVFLIALVIFLFFLFRGLFRVYTNYINTKRELVQMQKDLEKIKKRDIELDRKMQRFNSVEGKDMEIRKRLDVSAPGEQVIHIIDTSENSPKDSAR